jgi:hypothetical protein
VAIQNLADFYTHKVTHKIDNKTRQQAELCFAKFKFVTCSSFGQTAFGIVKIQMSTSWITFYLTCPSSHMTGKIILQIAIC